MFALVVLLGVLFGYVVLDRVGRAVSSDPAPPPWQAFVLAGVLGVLFLVVVGGTVLEVVRARRS
jgi:hypothetical protein